MYRWKRGEHQQGAIMEKAKNYFTTQTIVGLGLLTAIVVVLELVAGTIRLGPFNITLVLAPIVIGAALYGWQAGAWLGFVFGMIVLLSGQAALFMGFNVPGTIITVLLKGTGCGALAGLGFSLCQKMKANTTVSTVVSAVIAPLVNTGIFVLGCYIFFLPDIKAMASDAAQSVTAFILTGFVGLNFPIELIVNLILSSAIVLIIGIARRNGMASVEQKKNTK